MHNLIPRLPVGFALLLALAAGACGGTSTEGVESPDSLPLVDTTMSSSTSALASPAESSAPPPAPTITAEMLEEMLASEDGRALLVSGIGSEIGLDPEQAECLIDGVPVEALVEAANAFIGGRDDEGPFSSSQLEDIGPVLQVCEIPLESVTP